MIYVHHCFPAKSSINTDVKTLSCSNQKLLEKDVSSAVLHRTRPFLVVHGFTSLKILKLDSKIGISLVHYLQYDHMWQICALAQYEYKAPIPSKWSGYGSHVEIENDFVTDSRPKIHLTVKLAPRYFFGQPWNSLSSQFELELKKTLFLGKLDLIAGTFLTEMLMMSKMDMSVVNLSR